MPVFPVIKNRVCGLSFQKRVDIVKQVQTAGIKQSRGYLTAETGFQQQYPGKCLFLKQKMITL